MKVENNARKLFGVVLTIMIELYKLSMGSFLIYFVPQRCGDHICQIHELTYSPNLYNRIGLCINAFTLCMILFTYVWEWRRERWCIKNLDSDKSQAYNNLHYILTEEWNVERSLRSLNLHYIRALRLTTFACIINFLSSGYVIYNRYLDTSTAISYCSFGLLLRDKLKKSYTVGKKSYHNNLALSAYMTTPLSFNMLDKDQYMVDTTLEDEGYQYTALET